MNRIVKKLSLLGVLIGIFGCVVCAGNASAYNATQIQKTIMNKAVYQGVYDCYTNGSVKDDFGVISNYFGISSLVGSDKGGDIPLVSGVSTDSTWSRSAGYSIADGNLKCSELFSGGFYFAGGSNSDLLSVMNKSEPDTNNPSELKSFLSNMGYKITEASNDECYSIPVTISNNSGVLGQETTNSVCKDANGNLTTDIYGRNETSAAFVENGGSICLVIGNNATSNVVGCKASDDGAFGAEWLQSIIADSSVCDINGSCRVGAQTYQFDSAGAVESGKITGATAAFDGDENIPLADLRARAAMSAIQYLSGNSNFQNEADIALSPLEERVLDQLYLTEYYGVTVNCGDAGAYANEANKITWFDIDSSSMKTCYYDTSNVTNVNNGLNGTSDGFFKNGGIASMEDLLNTVKALPTEYSDEQITDFTGSIADSQNSDDGETDKCFQNAGALGWVLCPITSGLAKLGSSAYNWIEENFLQVKASIFTDNTYGVQEAWGTIRNIANIGFIVMLLVVVFSQVTGVGIDNYGIKRILPKIIIGAIIMNLSYIICELAIDVSNIFGNGLNDLLTNMGPDFSGAAGVNDPSIAQYLIVGGTGVLATAAYLILTSGGLGAILLLFIAILTVVVSILVLFVILIVRQAGIVICVVVAPIAILCYLLPNTEKVFKKWWELMKGLLLVYPLCGLVIGAGGFIGKVFGNLAVGGSGDMQMGFALSAMVVQVIPYLFIPMLLRSSLAAMGNLGAKISGFGGRISGGINKRIANSDTMKSSQELAAERRARFRAGIDSDGKPKKVGAIGTFMRGGKRGMARAANQYLKDEAVRRRGENLLNGVGLEAAIIGQQKQAEKNEMLDYMTLINNETRNGEDDKKLNELYDAYMEDGNKAGAVAVVRIAGRRKDTAASFMKRNIVEGDAASKYDPKIMSSVMKEVSTGENSGMYRTSNPLGFEFAAQYNRNYKDQYGANDVRPEAKYSAWRNQANVSQALDNYVTNSQELVGMKNSSLEEINKLIADGTVDETVAKRIRRLANETIDNRGRTGVWDSTKADNIYALASRTQDEGGSGTIQIVSEGGFNGQINNLRGERGGLASNQPNSNSNDQPNNNNSNNNNNDGSIIIPGRR